MSRPLQIVGVLVVLVATAFLLPSNPACGSGSAAWVEPGVFDAMPTEGPVGGFEISTRAAGDAFPTMALVHPELDARWGSGNYAVRQLWWRVPWLHGDFLHVFNGSLSLEAYHEADGELVRAAFQSALERLGVPDAQAVSLRATTGPVSDSHWILDPDADLDLEGLYSQLRSRQEPVEQATRLVHEVWLAFDAWAISFEVAATFASRQTPEGIQRFYVGAGDYAELRIESGGNHTWQQFFLAARDVFDALGLEGPRNLTKDDLAKTSSDCVHR